jgi:glycosyltransferase involved in cell wall biosynthesis
LTIVAHTLEGARDGLPSGRSRSFRQFRGFSKYFQTTLCAQGPRGEGSVVIEPGVEVVFTPGFTTWRGFLRKWPAISKALRSAIRGADVVLARMPAFEGVEAVRLGSSTPAYVSCFLGGDWPGSVKPGLPLLGGLKRGAASALTRYVAGHSELTLTQGSALRDWCIGRGIDAEAVIESGLEADDFLPPAHRFARDHIEMLCVAGLVHVKNVEAILDAVAILNRTSSRCHLRVAGRGPLRGELEARARRLGIDRHVTFVGHVTQPEDLHELYRNADLFVLSSLTEGVSHAVMEAMAASLPIVAPDVGSIRDIVRDGINGILLAQATPARIAAVVEDLAARPDWAMELGAQACRDARGLLHEHWVDRFHELVAPEVERRHSLRRVGKAPERPP